MDQPKTAGFTQKAELTRQRILDSALHLFGTKGYEATTMRDIAAEAECSLGLTYRYFTGKDELVLELYRGLAKDLEAQVNLLPAVSLADRFRQAMLAQFVLMAPHRSTLGALFGAALNPHSKVGVFGESTADVRRQTRNVFVRVVAGATDRPREVQAGPWQPYSMVYILDLCSSGSKTVVKIPVQPPAYLILCMICSGCCVHYCHCRQFQKH